MEIRNDKLRELQQMRTNYEDDIHRILTRLRAVCFWLGCYEEALTSGKPRFACFDIDDEFLEDIFSEALDLFRGCIKEAYEVKKGVAALDIEIAKAYHSEE